MDIELAQNTLPFVVQDTGHFQNFLWRTIGVATLEAGTQTLTLRPRKLANHAVMDVRQIRLEPRGIGSRTLDIRDVTADLILPPARRVPPAAGVRSLQAVPGTDDADYVLYLPTNWQPQRRYPVLVELCGNGPYRDKHGDTCSGRVEDGCLAFGLSGGYDYVVLTLPFLDNTGTKAVTQWWGNAPNYSVDATLAAWHNVIDTVCRDHQGDPERIVLTGFSRGAIACNFIGLHDDAIARRWSALVCFSHYAGVRRWPFSDSDSQTSRDRLGRLGTRPQFIVSENEVSDATSLVATRAHLVANGVDISKTQFAETGFRNHSDRWTMRPSATRKRVRGWLRTVAWPGGPPPETEPTETEPTETEPTETEPTETEPTEEAPN